MKKLLILFVIATPYFSLGQDLIEDNFPTKDGMIYYTDVINVDSSLSSLDLYLNAKEWLVDAFKSGKSVTQADDKNARLIIVKSFIKKGHNSYVSNPKKWFTLKIEMKDGRYRYSLYDIRYEFDINAMGQSTHKDVSFEEWARPSEGMSERKRKKVYKALKDYCKELDKEFKQVVASLREGMSKKEDDNW